MAFSDKEKSKILFYLGYPAKTLDSTSTSYSNIIAGRLNNNSADSESIARDLVKKIDLSRDEIEAAKARLKASVVEEIELNANEIKDRWREDAKLVRLLGDHLDIPVRCGSGSVMGNVMV